MNTREKKWIAIFIAVHFAVQGIAFFMELEDHVTTLTYKI